MGTHGKLWGTLFIVLSLVACSDPATEETLNGMTETQIVEAWGETDGDFVFDLTTSSNLFPHQGDLRRFFPSLREEDTIQVKELVWRGPIFDQAAWLAKDSVGNWVVFDNLTWGFWVVM